MRSIKKRFLYIRGYAIIFYVLLFVSIASVILIGVVGPIVSNYSAARSAIYSKQTFLAADSAAEEAYYRIKTGKKLAASQSVTLSSSTATIAVTDITGGKQITVNSAENGYNRNIQMNIAVGAGIDFNYGLQAGNGGVTIGGSSVINGNIYSNGSIDAVSATITGTAVAADSVSPVASEFNDTPSTPTNSITFGDTTVLTRDFAQSFRLSSTTVLNKVEVYIKRAASTPNATIMIAADNAGSPASSAIDSASLSASLLSPTTYGWIDVFMPNTPTLTKNTTYWLVIQTASQASTKTFTIGSNSSAYATGTAKVGKFSTGAWNATSTDGYFRIFTGGDTSYIGGGGYAGAVIIGTGSTGDAWASQVIGATVAGHMYCSANTTTSPATCDTSKGSPSPQAMPFSDANIQDWKDAADASTLNGNQLINSSGGSLGPVKIVGNLTVNGGGTLTLHGPIWVTGNVVISNGGSVVIPASYGKSSEAMVADGTITITGGASGGSGTSGSYLFMVSTSKCPNDVGCTGNAIDISGGSGAVAANAQSGTVSLTGNASIKAAVGNAISILHGSTVTYDSGLASPSFSSGPSGGYNVIDWTEI